jgi:NAD(P)-dependent dehydrogenase (short-subunit alcohol dehydrogenase family)
MEILISGASTGIGRASAVHLARTGHSVWAGVRTQKSFDEMTKLNVQNLKPIFLDVCDEKSIAACVSQVTKEAGVLHGLVNNAGIAVGGPVEGVTMEEWRYQFEVNVFGQIRVTQLCLPLLRQTKGRIVNTSSIAGRLASPFMGPYSASKFAFEAVSDSLRREVRRQGIYVSVVEPGPIDTPIWEKSLETSKKSVSKYPAEIQEVYGRSMVRFQERVATAEKRSSPVKVVVRAIEHALTARRPRTRYPVGRGIKLMALLANTMPDKVLDQLMS